MLMTPSCVFCLQIHAMTTTKSCTLRFILQKTHAPFYHRPMFDVDTFLCGYTDSTKNSYRGWRRGMGKGEGWVLHVHFWWQFFFYSSLGSTHVFSLPHVFIRAEERMSSVDKLRLLAVWRGPWLADSCFLHLQMHPRCLTTQYLLLISVSESPTRRSSTDEHRTSDDGREEGVWSVLPRKMVFLVGGCLNCRQLNLACLLLFEHSSKYKQDALHATFPLLRTPLHSTCCFHATSAILGSFPSATVVGEAAAITPPFNPSAENKEDVIY